MPRMITSNHTPNASEGRIERDRYIEVYTYYNTYMHMNHEYTWYIYILQYIYIYICIHIMYIYIYINIYIMCIYIYVSCIYIGYERVWHMYNQDPMGSGLSPVTLAMAIPYLADKPTRVTRQILTIKLCVFPPCSRFVQRKNMLSSGKTHKLSITIVPLSNHYQTW